MCFMLILFLLLFSSFNLMAVELPFTLNNQQLKVDSNNISQLTQDSLEKWKIFLKKIGSNPEHLKNLWIIKMEADPQEIIDNTGWWAQTQEIIENPITHEIEYTINFLGEELNQLWG